jgi:tetratricopeptide (TPR) repeat protein
VLLVAVKTCKLPTLSDHIRRCELFGVPEDAARQRFRQFMQAPIKPEAVPFPGNVFALSNIPIAVPEHFLGREEALAAVDAALKRHEGRVAITAVHGLRGVGKTTLAAAYAERRRGEYRATWWVRAQTPDSMRADLVSLGVRLGWVEPDEKEAPALDKVMERLRHEGEGLLIIYDNATQADALQAFLPKGGGARVLVTSNAPDWRGLGQPIELKLWPKDIGADYLIARTGRAVNERAEAERLSEALGGLPLAHEQAAAYCERLAVSFAEYARRLAATPIKLLDAEQDAPLDYHDKLTVAKTFALAIEEAAKLHPAAEPLIASAAQLAPEPIPLFLFSEARETFGEPLASQLADDGLDEAVAALRAFALVDREAIADERDPSVTTDTIRLHRLVRAIATGRRPGDTAGAGRLALIEAMASVYPSGVYDDPSAWPRARRLDALALDLIAGKELPPSGGETSASLLLDRLARYRQGALAAYAPARALFERALAIREKALGPEHPDTANILNNLANLLRDQGDLAGARPLLERALAILEKALGPEHPSTGTSLNNLAGLLHAQGDPAGARPLFERALAIREKALGPEHPLTATSLNNLALLVRDQGDLADARPLLERALAINEKALRPEHPSTAITLNNLAGLLQAQGDLAGARRLFERALAINEKALGPGHSSTATSLDNLAGLLQDQDDLAGARPILERALAIRERALGPEHPSTATVLTG